MKNNRDDVVVFFISHGDAPFVLRKELNSYSRAGMIICVSKRALKK